MSFKNTMKLFASNFTLAWKQLLYLAIWVFVFILCSYTLISPIVDILKKAGLGTEIESLLSVVYNNPKDIFVQLTQVVKLITTSIIDNISKIYLNLIGCLILCIILPYILIQTSIYNMSSILYQKFTMNMDVEYVKNGLDKFGNSLRFSFANLLLELPYLAIYAGLVYLYLIFSTTVLKTILGLIVFSALSLMINSIKITLFSYYTGCVVANDSNPISTFTKSLKIELKNFWKIVGNSFVILLTLIFINCFIAVFTLFAGLIFTIPASMVLLCIYKLVVYLNISGNRYYLSNSVIYNPKKYEVKKDDFVSTFIPPEETKEITTTKMKKQYKKRTNSKNKSKSKKIK